MSLDTAVLCASSHDSFEEVAFCSKRFKLKSMVAVILADTFMLSPATVGKETEGL